MRAIKIFLSVAVVCGALLASLYWYMLGMPGRSHVGPLPPLTADEQRIATTLRSHVEMIAATPRNTALPGSLDQAARAIERELVALGYTPRLQPYTTGGVDVRNIEVTIEPSASTSRDSIDTLVVGAHYDTHGNSPGANDNGSGVAALLVLARDLKSHATTRTRLRLVFFVNEEEPFFATAAMGSLVYARALKATGERVKAMLSLETLGTYSDAAGSQRYPPDLARLLGFALPDVGNFVAFVGGTSSRALVAEVTRRFRETTAFPSLGGVAPGYIEGILWSDHWSFEEVGIPAMMLTDTALFRDRHYHQPSDTPDKLDYERLARVTAGIGRVIRAMAP